MLKYMIHVMPLCGFFSICRIHRGLTDIFSQYAPIFYVTNVYVLLFYKDFLDIQAHLNVKIYVFSYIHVYKIFSKCSRIFTIFFMFSICLNNYKQLSVYLVYSCLGIQISIGLQTSQILYNLMWEFVCCIKCI